MILTKKPDTKSMMESDKHEKLKRFWVEKSTSKSSQYFKNTCTCIHLHRDSERRVLVQTLPRPATGSPLGIGRGLTTFDHAPTFTELKNKQSNILSCSMC